MQFGPRVKAPCTYIYTGVGVHVHPPAKKKKGVLMFACDAQTPSSQVQSAKLQRQYTRFDCDLDRSVDRIGLLRN